MVCGEAREYLGFALRCDVDYLGVSFYLLRVLRERK
jgi:hypothetical protein